MYLDFSVGEITENVVDPEFNSVDNTIMKRCD